MHSTNFEKTKLVRLGVENLNLLQIQWVEILSVKSDIDKISRDKISKKKKTSG